ncbi:sulfurtransferase TusA family protein [Marinomonas sp. M1K-6]|uniref:Sulfurtransferase TusA family protein n=1 Tax=Marinomonas profundi TaxID=2726122 RepID=A0A847QUS9_9GAMM|nr:sulfurtransferase TusA family protein [Marinomonas profundi]NLQ16318.1 sulfurtransferase TusA family protein [Marinomonas profundi]UDV03106.1 sulfurtransferase TusA family protein [Marinomonas profundi]
MMVDVSNQYDVILDVREDRCPMPLLKAKMALSKMQAGECLCVISGDSGSLRDIPQYVALVGFSLLSLSEEERIYRFVIQKN